MEWDKYHGAAGEPLWPNVTAMFNAALRALEDRGEHRVTVESGYLSWH